MPARNPNKRTHFYLCQAAWFEHDKPYTEAHCRCANVFDVDENSAKDQFLEAVYSDQEPPYLQNYKLMFFYAKEIDYNWFVAASKFYIFPRTPLRRRLSDFLYYIAERVSAIGKRTL